MSSFWPLSIPQWKSKGKVPGTSNWVGEILHDCNSEVLHNVNQVFDQFSRDIDSIDEFMQNALDEKNVDVFIDSFAATNTKPAKSIKSATVSPRVSPVKYRNAPKSSPLAVSRPSPVRNRTDGNEQIIIPYSPSKKPSTAPSPLKQELNSDDSLHKIQMSIRRQTEALGKANSSNNNTLSFPTKTPRRSPTFVSLPPKEPLTIKSSVSRISRKSLAATKDRKDKSDTVYHHESPIRRNRFPSVIEGRSSNDDKPNEKHEIENKNEFVIKSKQPEIKSASPKVQRKSLEAKFNQIIPKSEPANNSDSSRNLTTTPSTASTEETASRPRNLFYNVMTPTAVHRAYSSSRLSPARKVLSRTSKTPSKYMNGVSRSSISSLDTNKPGSKSPTRYTDKQFKRSSIAFKDDDTDPTLFQKSIPQKRATNPGPSRVTKTPKLNDTDSAGTSTRNRFLTTSLNPNNAPAKLPVKSLQSPVKLTQKVQPPEEHKPVDKNKLSLGSGTIPPLKKKSLMLPKSDKSDIPKPKQKIVLSMGHSKKSSAHSATPSKSGSTTPVLNSVGALKHKLELPSEASKKRPLVRNAVALPEAARPHHVSRVKEATKLNKEGTAPSVGVTKPDLRPQLKTPKRDPNFQLFKNLQSPGDPELPDIDTDDEDNASRRLLKTWAATPELRKLILKNNQVDPKSIFGEVPKLRIEDIFKSEASRMRGNAPSPVRYNKDVAKFKEGASSNVKGSV